MPAPVVPVRVKRLPSTSNVTVGAPLVAVPPPLVNLTACPPATSTVPVPAKFVDAALKLMAVAVSCKVISLKPPASKVITPPYSLASDPEVMMAGLATVAVGASRMLLTGKVLPVPLKLNVDPPLIVTLLVNESPAAVFTMAPAAMVVFVAVIALTAATFNVPPLTFMFPVILLLVPVRFIVPATKFSEPEPLSAPE
jgi:hypothetical protein